MLAEQNPHPRDCNIHLDERTHTYHIAINEVVVTSFMSVTKLVKSHFQPFDSQAALKTVRRSMNRKYIGMTDAAVLKKWREDGKKAAEQGTTLHKKIEDFYNGEGFSIDEGCPDQEQFIQFWQDHKHELTPYRTEWEVYDEDAKLAGSIDMVFKDSAGKFLIYDWKRTKEIKPGKNYGKFGRGLARDLPDCSYWHYALQLNTYKFILSRRYGLEIDAMYLVRFHPESSGYEKIHLPDLQSLVSSILATRGGSLDDVSLC